MADLIFGVNLPWLDGAYGHDLATTELKPTWPCEFDTLRAYLPFVQAADLGFGAVRVWLCENGEGIVTENGRPARPHPRLVESVTVLEECARLLGLRIYWTLLDGNGWKREGDSLTHAILTDEGACARFAENVAAPLAARMDPAVTYAIEVVNEPEALSLSCEEIDGAAWNVLGRSIRRVADALRAARPGVTVTAGTNHVYLAQLCGAEPALYAYDVHVYHKTGGLPSRDELAARTGDARIAKRSMPLIAGECGAADGTSGDPALLNYLFNASKLGYDAVFLWRLEGPLVTPEKRRTDLANKTRDVMKQLTGGSR